MKKTFLLLICIATTYTQAFAQTWDIQDSDFLQGLGDFQMFADDTVQDIYTNDNYLPLMDMVDAKQTLDQLTQSYDDVTSTLEMISSRRDALLQHSNTAKLALTRTIQDMESHQQQVLYLQREITLMYSKIRSWQQSLEEIQQDIQDIQEHIRRYSQILYKISNDFYISDNEISTVKLLSKSDNIANALWKDELISLLHNQLQFSFTRIQNMHQIRQKSIFELQSITADYVAKIKTYQQDIKTLEEQKTHVSELVSYLDQDQKFVQNQYNQLQSSQLQLWDQMDRINKITDSTSVFIDQNTDVSNLLSERDIVDGPTYFSWPHRMVTGIISTQQYPELSNSDSIYLQAQQWQEIYAPAPAIVYKTMKHKNIGLQRVILLHKYGYVSVISPLSEIYVEPGDIVSRGEMLWLAGGTPGTVWAWLDSPVPHTALQIYKNAKLLDPYLVLDTSIFVDSDELDPLYHLKWKQDYLARGIDLSNLPDLQWETVDQRRDYFLSKSGAGTFSDPNIWLQASAETGIDPVFGICIWAAETSYRNFKSGNNIGNVWNDDSGNTRVFATPVDGVKAVFNTLNNRYLGEYTTMDQLSRYGNKDSYIYASDPINRQKNIMRCLSMIYEQNVPEQYFFRTLKQS